MYIKILTLIEILILLAAQRAANKQNKYKQIIEYEYFKQIQINVF